jgi:transposase
VISSSPSGEESGEVDHELVLAPDPAPRPRRRTFTARYKSLIVAEYEAAPHGEKSAVLRREGLYHSHIREWSAARDAGALSGLADARTSARRPHRATGSETERLRAQNARLAAQLAQTRAALDIMGKVHVLLETLSESTDTSAPSPRS